MSEHVITKKNKSRMWKSKHFVSMHDFHLLFVLHTNVFNKYLSLQITVIILYVLPDMTSRNPAFLPPSVPLCLLQISELTVIITIKTTNRLFLAVGMHYVFCEA
jgi:hypothetical protein